MGHVGQELTLCPARFHGLLHGLFQRLRSFVHFLFQLFMLLHQTCLRFNQALNHAVETLPQEFDFISGLGKFNAFQIAPAHFFHADLQKPDRLDQLFDRKASNGPGHHQDYGAQQQTFAWIKVALVNIIGKNNNHNPQHQ